MRNILSFSKWCLAVLIVVANVAAMAATHVVTQTQQQALTPDQVLQKLIEGNKRFVAETTRTHDYLKQAKLTSKGQHPAAIILSCIDSRVPPEVIFDQPIGNIFVSRVAANVMNKDVLGGMEFATKVAGAKLIVVLGHDSCGAVNGACQNVKLGHLTHLLKKVQPAIKQTTKQLGEKNCNDPRFIDSAAANNVRNVVQKIVQKSAILSDLIKQGKLKIVGAMYHLDTGKVTFLN